MRFGNRTRAIGELNGTELSRAHTSNGKERCVGEDDDDAAPLVVT